MTKKTFILIVIGSCAWIATSFAATVPAGTTVVVRTLNTIQSTDRVGRTFTAQLDQDVAVNGKVVLRAGRSEEHTSELQSLRHLVCRLLLEKKKTRERTIPTVS